MAQIPTPLPFPISELQTIRKRCDPGDCETWEAYAGGCPVDSFDVAPHTEGPTNWANAQPLTGVGGGSCGGPVPPDCRGNWPLSSRFTVCIPKIRPVKDSALPAQLAPPPIHIEIRGGAGCCVSRLARVVWTPNSWNDFGLIVQVQGVLVTQWEVWGWAENIEGERETTRAPLEASIHMLIDRIGSGPYISASPQGGAVYIPPFANIAFDTA